MNDSPAGELFLGRQPILDAEGHLVAYELLFRGDHRNAAHITDGVQATATVIANAFAELAVGDALGSRRGFINVDFDFLFSDLLEILPRQSVVLEILETVPPTPAVVRRCADLKAQGFTLALDDVVRITPEYGALLHLVEFVKVDIQPLSRVELMQLVLKLKPLGKQLLAEKVDSREQMEHCRKLGFSLFQGYYFAKPTILVGKKLDPSQLALIKLMGLLLGDAETDQLEEALKSQPVLSLNLLRLTNSVGAGTAVRITSLRHAITVLGRRQLQRWLQLLLFASGSPQGTASPLLNLAATRGRLMELLAGQLQPGQAAFADQAFMVGIMSLMPALVALPIAELIAPLGVAPAVHDALCAGSGVLGAMLALTAASEGEDTGALAAALDALSAITPADYNRCLTQALAWAAQVGQEGG